MMATRNSKEYRTALRAASIPTGDNVSKIELKDGSAVVYVWTVAGKPYATGFRGTAGHAEFYYSFKSDDARRDFVTRWLDRVRMAQADKASRRAEKSAWKNPLKVGDILYTCWGYDQTNVEFFAVTRVSGRRTWIREIARDYEQTGFMSGKTWPAMPIRFVGEEMLRIAQPSGKDGVYIKINNSANAHLEDGRERHTSSYA